MPTAERAAAMLGYRTGGVYGADYDRMGGTILRNIMAAGSSGVEAYVRTHHADLATSTDHPPCLVGNGLYEPTEPMVHLLSVWERR